jgi:hypothetical protein
MNGHQCGGALCRGGKFQIAIVGLSKRNPVNHLELLSDERTAGCDRRDEAQAWDLSICSTSTSNLCLAIV